MPGLSSDAQTDALLAQMREAGAPALHELPVEEARAALLEMSVTCGYPDATVFATEDRMIPTGAGDVRIRIYWPSAPDRTAPKPVLLFFHGGGFALGDIECHDSVVRYLCEKAGCIAVSVDYRRSPEHKFPAGLEDCYAVLTWAKANAASLGGDAERIGIAGDSAGGNLSASLCLMARDRHGPKIACQILIYPAVDMIMSNSYPSYTAFGQGDYFLSVDDMNWITGMYFEKAEDARSPYASPLFADLAGLPPALVITAGLDPLCDQGLLYHERLLKAGNMSEHRRFEGAVHGFFNFAGVLEIGVRGMDAAVTGIKRYLG